MSVVEEIQGFLLSNPPQLDNMWEFSVRSTLPSSFEETFRYMVSDISIPFPKLLYETAANGEKYYTSVSFPDEFQVTIKESHSPAQAAIVGTSSKVLSWWDTWFNQNYDFKTGKFVGFVNTNESNRTGVLRLLTDDVSLIGGAIAVTPVTRSVIFDNILLSIARGVADRANGKLTGLTGLTVNTGLKPITAPVPLGMVGSTVSTTKTVAEFRFINLKPVGIEQLSLTYSDGKPLEYRLSMVCDRLEFSGL